MIVVIWLAIWKQKNVRLNKTCYGYLWKIFLTCLLFYIFFSHNQKNYINNYCQTCLKNAENVGHIGRRTWYITEKNFCIDSCWIQCDWYHKYTDLCHACGQNFDLALSAVWLQPLCLIKWDSFIRLHPSLCDSSDDSYPDSSRLLWRHLHVC